MFSILGCETRLCDGIPRRDFLQIGALGIGGLTLADLFRLKSQAATSKAGAPAKSVIMVYLQGGPSHIDMYDMKPDAPVEFRGEFQPIRTKVPGLDICELMPLQAQIADKLSVIRGMKFKGAHNPYELLSGYPAARTLEIREKWPVFGSVVSRLRGDRASAMPPYVNINPLSFGPEVDEAEVPRYLGPAHGPFRPSGPGLKDLRLPAGVSLQRLEQRKALLAGFDEVRRQAEVAQENEHVAAFQRQAVEMVTSGDVYKALDLSLEPQLGQDRFKGCTNLLLARRLVEAGVSVVTVALGGKEGRPGSFLGNIWDSHKEIFPHYRAMLPAYDHAVHALLTDLQERGLDQQVAVVIWGEFGRTPKIGTDGAEFATGRGHWPDAGFALLAGGGLRMGQVIGETDARGERHKGNPYTPQNV
ncbi:MAG: DUF1501 domain-containing protein, partial [Pirellulaceae bacterium]|nr:DUF1501 domain-containing protein [Pirellulaceae bacterium]